MALGGNKWRTQGNPQLRRVTRFQAAVTMAGEWEGALRPGRVSGAGLFSQPAQSPRLLLLPFLLGSRMHGSGMSWTGYLWLLTDFTATHSSFPQPFRGCVSSTLTANSPSTWSLRHPNRSPLSNCKLCWRQRTVSSQGLISVPCWSFKGVSFRLGQLRGNRCPLSCLHTDGGGTSFVYPLCTKARQYSGAATEEMSGLYHHLQQSQGFPTTLTRMASRYLTF